MPGLPAVSLPREAPLPRGLILFVAVVLALAVSSVTQTPVADAQETRAPAAPAQPAPPQPPAAAADPAKAAPGDERRPTFEITINEKADAAKEAADTAAAANEAKEALPAERTVTVKKGGKTLTVTGIPGDEEFDSFGDLVHRQPAVGAMIVMIVGIVFLSPVLAIALVVFYRMRKTRMQNETMLKLAERGIVTTPEALAAVGGNPSAAALAAAGDAVKGGRVRAAWSDLRKGVVMTAIGLALTAHSLLDDHSPNALGLVLLFLGIGYGVLWWFEQRQIGALPARAGGIPGSGPGDAGNGA